MKYVAFLRGINVGGKASVDMALLKKAFEDSGFTHVLTYINSGNVIFQADQLPKTLEKQIETVLENTFFKIVTVVVSETNLRQVVAHAPKNWNTNDIRKYIAFMKSPATPDDLMSQSQPREGIDTLEKGPGVVYLSTRMDGITKSGLSKLVRKPVYKLMTMRNMNTVEKLLLLMQKV